MEIKFSDLKNISPKGALVSGNTENDSPQGGPRELSFLMEREFIITNGLGSFASSTICGLNTRTYHGLLVSAAKPPTSRNLLFSKIDEILTIDGTDYQLATNQWHDGSIAPQGYQYLSEFAIDPYPTWVFEIGDIKLTKKIILIYGQDILQVNYKISGNKANCHLKLVFLVNHRSFHNVTTGEASWYFKQKQENTGVIIQAFEGATPLCLGWTKGNYERTETWYYKFLYREEQKRGLDHTEDNYNPGNLLVDLADSEEITITASTEKIAVVPDFAQAKTVLLERFNKIMDYPLINYGENLSDDIGNLFYAADQFLVKRSSTSSKSVIAGYHWFADWGRDTMIALPGLTLVTNRFSEAKSILKTFTNYIEEGLIPNRFPDTDGSPEYNTVDATLWFFQAVLRYLEYTGDDDFVYKNIFSHLKKIIEFHIHGTKFGIKVDPKDGLLTSGAEKQQLTWMDAKVEDNVITPRRGKPVEINVLWYNALKITEFLAKRYREDSFKYFELARKVKNSVESRFWNAEKQCLYDYISPEGTIDDKIRPNQIFALSLPYSIFPKEKETAILKTVEAKLLTPYGLRTLDPADPAYKGRYEGDRLARDQAYHQGTVWPWLIGPFITAFIKNRGRNEATVSQAKAFLQPLLKHLSNDACIGSVSEIFDGDPPYLPRGCISQAWSVAEVLRCLLEDIYELKPPELTLESDYITDIIKF
jgi:predicted glycogen debranching enzyme